MRRPKFYGAVLVVVATLALSAPPQPAGAVTTISGVCVLELSVELKDPNPAVLGNESLDITTAPPGGECTTSEGDGTGWLTTSPAGSWLCTAVGEGTHTAGVLQVEIRGEIVDMDPLMVRAEGLGGLASITATRLAAPTVVAQGVFVQDPVTLVPACVSGVTQATWSGVLAFVDPTTE